MKTSKLTGRPMCEAAERFLEKFGLQKPLLELNGHYALSEIDHDILRILCDQTGEIDLLSDASSDIVAEYSNAQE